MSAVTARATRSSTTLASDAFGDVTVYGTVRGLATASRNADSCRPAIICWIRPRLISDRVVRPPYRFVIGRPFEIDRFRVDVQCPRCGDFGGRRPPGRRCTPRIRPAPPLRCFHVVDQVLEGGERVFLGLCRHVQDHVGGNVTDRADDRVNRPPGLFLAGNGDQRVDRSIVQTYGLQRGASFRRRR